MGVVNLLEALEIYSKRAGNTFKFYQASTSEMYGQTDGALDESSIFNPVSPYAIAKAAAHYYCRMKRGQGMFVANGILFNHESEIRGGDFVTQKIVAGVVDFVKSGHSFALGNLDSVRDWGYRPNDVTHLKADSSKARDELGWSPITSFEEMVAKMYRAELARRS
jgi:GDPmannose 4,6-dehydratase